MPRGGGRLHIRALSLIQGSLADEAPHSTTSTRDSWSDACVFAPPATARCVQPHAPLVRQKIRKALLKQLAPAHADGGARPERNSKYVLTLTCTPPLTSFKDPATISCCLKYKYCLEKSHNQGKANIQVPSGSLRPTLALLIHKQVNVGNTVTDFQVLLTSASQYEQISLFECFLLSQGMVMISHECILPGARLAFPSGVLPHCPAPATVLQALLLPPTQATSTPWKYTQPHGQWFVTPQSSI